MPPSEAVISAKARAETLVLAQQSLQYWLQIGGDILQGASSAAQSLADGDDAALPARAIRQNGVQCLRKIGAIEAKITAVVAALGAVYGFPEAEITESIAYLRATCEAMRDTPADGSELAALLTTIGQRHSAMNLLG